MTSIDINKRVELGTAIQGQLIFGNRTGRKYENIIKERVMSYAFYRCTISIDRSQFFFSSSKVNLAFAKYIIYYVQPWWLVILFFYTVYTIYDYNIYKCIYIIHVVQP